MYNIDYTNLVSISICSTTWLMLRIFLDSTTLSYFVKHRKTSFIIKPSRFICYTLTRSISLHFLFIFLYWLFQTSLSVFDVAAKGAAICRIVLIVGYDLALKMPKKKTGARKKAEKQKERQKEIRASQESRGIVQQPCNLHMVSCFVLNVTWSSILIITGVWQVSKVRMTPQVVTVQYLC